MDIGTCHLSLVSPLYAAKLVVSYMLHRDTGRAQSKMTQPSYLSPHPPTSQHSLSQQTHPVHCWAPMWQGPCSPTLIIVLTLTVRKLPAFVYNILQATWLERVPVLISWQELPGLSPLTFHPKGRSPSSACWLGYFMPFFVSGIYSWDVFDEALPV